MTADNRGSWTSPPGWLDILPWLIGDSRWIYLASLVGIYGILSMLGHEMAGMLVIVVALPILLVVSIFAEVRFRRWLRSLRINTLLAVPFGAESSALAEISKPVDQCRLDLPIVSRQIVHVTAAKLLRFVPVLVILPVALKRLDLANTFFIIIAVGSLCSLLIPMIFRTHFTVTNGSLCIEYIVPLFRYRYTRSVLLNGSRLTLHRLSMVAEVTNPSGNSIRVPLLNITHPGKLACAATAAACD